MHANSPGSRRSSSVWLLVFSLFLPAAAWAQDAGQAAEEIRQRRLAQNAAIAAQDYASVASYWVEDVVLTAGLGVVLAGADAYRHAFQVSGGLTYERIPEEISVSAPWPLAFETGRWEGRDESGAALMSGRYSAQWVKESETWLIRSELFVATDCEGQPCTWPVRARPGGPGGA